MYSKTYSSPEEYVEQAVDSYWVVAVMQDQTPSSCKVTEHDAQVVASAPVMEYGDATLMPLLARCFPDVGAVRAVAVEHARRHVDWAAGRYLGTRRVRIAGPLPLTGNPH
jgi:hypothetical protein